MKRLLFILLALISAGGYSQDINFDTIFVSHACRIQSQEEAMLPYMAIAGAILVGTFIINDAIISNELRNASPGETYRSVSQGITRKTLPIYICGVGLGISISITGAIRTGNH